MEYNPLEIARRALELFSATGGGGEGPPLAAWPAGVTACANFAREIKHISLSLEDVLYRDSGIVPLTLAHTRGRIQDRMSCTAEENGTGWL